MKGMSLLCMHRKYISKDLKFLPNSPNTMADGRALHPVLVLQERKGSESNRPAPFLVWLPAVGPSVVLRWASFWIGGWVGRSIGRANRVHFFFFFFVPLPNGGFGCPRKARRKKNLVRRPTYCPEGGEACIGSRFGVRTRDSSRRLEMLHPWTWTWT